MTQRVVVVGATGHIGRPLCRELLRAGNLVTVFSRDPVRAQHWLPVPTPFVRMGLGVITDILVRGKRVIPSRASELGYRFRFPVLVPALHDLLGQPDNESVAAP